MDTVVGTLSVPDEKMAEIFIVLDEWRRRRSAGRVELQSLLGKLHWVTKCVQQSRVFLNRMLGTLRSIQGFPK